MDMWVQLEKKWLADDRGKRAEKQGITRHHDILACSLHFPSLHFYITKITKKGQSESLCKRVEVVRQPTDSAFRYQTQQLWKNLHSYISLRTHKTRVETGHPDPEGPQNAAEASIQQPKMGESQLKNINIQICNYSSTMIFLFSFFLSHVLRNSENLFFVCYPSKKN